jgi:hypothetical protein
MDGNLLAMIIALVVYIGSLGVASAKNTNLKGLAVVAVLAALWFGFQWNSWIGIIAVFGGIVIGVSILKLTVGGRSNG